jgi:Ca-activated chloride channel family protein
VFENGVRQQDVNVDIAHAPVTLAVLFEHGGRSYQLNRAIASDAEYIVRPLLGMLERDDKLAVFAYDDTLRTIIDFDTPYDQWSSALTNLPAPRFSEANFYDAAAAVIDRVRTLPGRRAMVIVSTGIDTFSRATFADVAQRAEAARVPIYVFSLGERAKQRLATSPWGPLSRADWAGCERRLEELARISGGRAYVRAMQTDAEAIFDDVMENLRVRYVVSYRAPAAATSAPRNVQVALIEPDGSTPPRTVSAAGRAQAPVRVIAQGTYTADQFEARSVSGPPSMASGREFRE